MSDKRTQANNRSRAPAGSVGSTGGQFVRENRGDRRAATADVGVVNLESAPPETTANVTTTTPLQHWSASQWSKRVGQARTALSQCCNSVRSRPVDALCEDIKGFEDEPFYPDLVTALYQGTTELDGTSRGNSTPHPSLGGPDLLMVRVKNWGQKSGDYNERELADRTDRILKRRIEHLDWMAEGLRLAPGG